MLHGDADILSPTPEMNPVWSTTSHRWKEVTLDTDVLLWRF